MIDPIKRKYSKNITAPSFKRRYNSDFKLKERSINKTPDLSYDSQKQWLLDYIKSPVYRQLLENEYKNSNKDLSLLDKEIKNRYNRINNTKIQEKQADSRGYNYTRALYYDLENDPSRIDLYTNKPYNIDLNNRGNIVIDPLVRQLDPALLTHELTHASTVGDKYITDYSKKLISQTVKKDMSPYQRDINTGIVSGYYDSPTEVHGRLTELKMLLDRYNIVDTKKHPITKKHIDTLFSNKELINEDTKVLYETMLNKDINGLLNLLNKIAYQNVNTNNINMAKYGGSIKINPKNVGKFNATKKRTGKTTEELTHSKNPITKKRAIFAQNAAKWKKEEGGWLENNADTLMGMTGGLAGLLSDKGGYNTGKIIGNTIGQAANLLLPGAGMIAGPVLGAIGGLFDKDPQREVMKQHINQLSNTTNPYGMAYGGKLTGRYDAAKYNGNTHAMGGIMVNSMGVPTNTPTAEVEDQELVVKMKDGSKYIFSKALKI